MAKDLHKEPFDEGTKVKLTLFENYLIEWLRVFFAIKEPYWKVINICDFFAGPGYDENMVEGTPIIILKNIKFYENVIREKGFEVNIYMNEKATDKYQELLTHITAFKALPVNLIARNERFADLFEELYPTFNDAANLFFIDQSGIKEITKEIFLKIITLSTTDFLLFTSSSYLKRFPNILNRYLEIPTEKIENTKYHDIHRLVQEAYKGFIPVDKIYHMSSFSIKKESNIFGLIFGSNHIKGIEKFLDVAWKIDPLRGESNFDIDSDRINSAAPSFFEELNKPTKLRQFEKELEDSILDETMLTNKDIILFTRTRGFLIIHANNVIKKLISERKIPKQSLNLGEKVYKKTFNIIEIKLK